MTLAAPVLVTKRLVQRCLGQAADQVTQSIVFGKAGNPKTNQIRVKDLIFVERWRSAALDASGPDATDDQDPVQGRVQRAKGCRPLAQIIRRAKRRAGLEKPPVGPGAMLRKNREIVAGHQSAPGATVTCRY